MSCIAQLTAVLKPTNGKKKRKLNTTAAARVPSIAGLTSLAAPAPQKVGYTVQVIVEGWDRFATHLGFNSIEDMVLPYVRITRPHLKFEVIQDRDEGFVHKSQRKRLNLDVNLTSTPEETFQHVLARSPELDRNIRIVVKDFFSDVYSSIHSSALYTTTEQRGWDHLDQFNMKSKENDNRQFPTRFRQYSKTVINAIRKEMPSKAPVQAQEPPRPLSPPAPILGTAGGWDVDVDPQDHRDEEASSTTLSRSRPIFPLPPASHAEIKKEWEELKTVIKPFCRMYNCRFQNLVEADELLSVRGAFAGKVQLLLTDPPYNVRRERGSRGSENAEYDLLEMSDMRSVVKWANTILRPGGHAVIFCSVQQFHLWVDLFRNATVETDQVQSGKAFSVDPTPMIFARHPRAHGTFPGKKSCALSNAVEFAVHLKKNGLTFKEEEAMVNYHSFNYVPSTYPAWKNIIDNVKGLLPKEQVRCRMENGKTKHLRSEQKPIALLKEIISRFSQKGDIVVDFFSGTYSTAIACFSLPNHRLFIGCEADKMCHTHATNHVKQTFATVCTEKATDIVLSKHDQDLVTKISERHSTNPPNGKQWKPPGSLPPYQRLPEHILSHLATVFHKPELLRTCITLPVHEWPRRYQSLLEQADPRVLRYIEAAKYGLMLSTSSIKHPEAGLGVFAAKTFREGDEICPYYGTLVYHYLGERKEKTKTYGEGILGVNVQRYKQYSLQFHTQGATFANVRDQIDGKKAVCVVAAPFCIAGYINCHHYHEHDDDYNKAIGEDFDPGFSKRKPNVAYVSRSKVIRRASELIEYDQFVLEANTLINPGDELFADYRWSNFAKHTMQHINAL